jgi:hypothetical protein
MTFNSALKGAGRAFMAGAGIVGQVATELSRGRYLLQAKEKLPPLKTAIDEMILETNMLVTSGRPTTPSDIKMMQEIADQLTAMSASLSSRAEQLKDLTTSP